MTFNLFNRIGGDAAVEATVNLFYKKFLQHRNITQFFCNISTQQQIEKMRQFLTIVLSGDLNVCRESIRQAHAPLVANGLNDSHFNLFVHLMHESLSELEIPEELIEEFITITESFRDDVLCR